MQGDHLSGKPASVSDFVNSQGNVRKKVIWKSVQKLFITSWIFAFIWVFSGIQCIATYIRYIVILSFVNSYSLWSNCGLDSVIIYINTSSTGVLWVLLNMRMSASHHQGNVGEFWSVWRVVTLCKLYCIFLGNAAVRECWKSASIWRSYVMNIGTYTFFLHTLYSACTQTKHWTACMIF